MVLILPAHFSICIDGCDLWLPVISFAHLQVGSSLYNGVRMMTEDQVQLTRCSFLHVFFWMGFIPASSSHLHLSICLRPGKHRPLTSPTFNWSPLLWLGFVLSSFSRDRALHGGNFSRREEHVQSMQYCLRCSGTSAPQKIQCGWTCNHSYSCGCMFLCLHSTVKYIVVIHQLLCFERKKCSRNIYIEHLKT